MAGEHAKPRAVVLLSGGLDSATACAVAVRDGFECHALTFDYSQRHREEIDAARRVAESLGLASHRVYPLDLSLFTTSALTAPIEVPKDRAEDEMTASIPVTYVPARNLIFLSVAVGYAETLGAADIYLGVNAVDYSGYPDCRPEFIESFAETANLATRVGVESAEGTPGVRLHTPLIDLTKAQIIVEGTRLGVNYAHTHSCYDPSPEGLACGRCDSCLLRKKGFADAGIPDPTRYAHSVGDA